MTVPYGEPESGESVHGATLRYEKASFLTRGLLVSALAGYSHRSVEFQDLSPWVYDWLGQRVFRRPERTRPPGEISGDGVDSVTLEHRGIGRLGLAYLLTPDHRLRLVSSAFLTTRAGRDRLWRSPRLDPFSDRARTTTVVSGLEHEAHLFDERLENIAFVKDYRFKWSAEQVIEDLDIRSFVESEPRQSFGVGDALRVKVLNGVSLKASYEYATRLPRPDEVFGDGTVIIGNPALAPERSDNANLGVTLEAPRTAVGAFRAELNGFVRDVDDLIQLVPAFDPTYAQYINVAAVTSLGFDATLGWASPRDLLSLDGNVTWFDLRNRSERGSFARFEGDRVANRPWFTVNGNGRFRLANLATKQDELWLSFGTQYVGPFFTAWESAGRRDTKSKLPPQLVHGAGVGYLVRGRLSVSGAFDLQNVTDEVVYDVFGVQKMGRALFFKSTVEL